MNAKVKLAWLEYLAELLPLMDSGQLHDSTEVRQALNRLVLLTSDPKSGDIRRSSQKVLYGLFELNPATFTMMQRNMEKGLQETMGRILKNYVQVGGARGWQGGGEGGREGGGRLAFIKEECPFCFFCVDVCVVMVSQ